MEKKRNRKFSLIDFTVIILVLLCIFSLVYKFILKNNEGKTDDTSGTFSISFISENQRYSTAECIKPDKDVKIKNTNTILGKISGNVSTTNSKIIYTDTNGNNVEVMRFSDDENINRYDISGVILCSGTLSSDGIFTSSEDENLKLAVNDKVTVCTSLASFEIKVTSITSE